MKKASFYKYTLLAATLSLVLPGACDKGPEPPLGHTVITARIEGAAPQAKTSYDSDGPYGEFVWSPGDKIAVHYSDGAYVDTISVNPANGELKAPSTAQRYRDCYAVYPAAAAVAANYGNPDLQVNLPAGYDISAIVAGTSPLGSAAKDYSPCPMVAVNDVATDILDFRHVGGLLRLHLLNIPPATVQVRVRFDSDVTGPFTVENPGSPEPAVTSSGLTGRNAVLFDLVSDPGGSGGVGTPGTVVLNVPVPCGTYYSVRAEALDSQGANLGFVNISYTLKFSRHYGKKFWLLFSRATLGLEGEGIWWTDRLNEGEDLFWEGNTDLNRGEGITWK